MYQGFKVIVNFKHFVFKQKKQLGDPDVVNTADATPVSSIENAFVGDLYSQHMRVDYIFKCYQTDTRLLFDVI